MKKRLEGRVAVVTGGGRGIGRAIALALGGEGAAIVVNDLGTDTSGGGQSADPAQKTAETIIAGGGIAVATVLSVAEPDGPAGMVDTAMREFGRLDILVNTAGVVQFTPFTDISEDDWDLVVGVHVGGHLACARAALPAMRQTGYGRLINFVSGVGIIREAGLSSYSLAKRGVAALTVALGRDVQGSAVTVNAISPLAFTRMVAAIPEEGEEVEIPPMYRAVPPPELIAPLAVFLATPAAAWINGQIIYTNGYELSLIQMGPVLETVQEVGPVGDGSFREFAEKVLEPAVAAGAALGGAAVRVRVGEAEG